MCFHEDLIAFINLIFYYGEPTDNLDSQEFLMVIMRCTPPPTFKTIEDGTVGNEQEVLGISKSIWLIKCKT